MKKTLIALSVLVAAGSVNAATIYENEGSSVSVSGEVKAVYVNTEAKTSTTKDENSKLKSKGNVQFDISHEINADLKALASFEFDFESNKTTKEDDVWVGLQGNFGTFKAGETGQPIGVLENVDIVSEAKNVAIPGIGAKEGDGQGLRYSNDFGPVAVSAAYFFTLDEEKKGTGVANDKTKGAVELSAEYSSDMFTVAAAYGAGERELTSKAVDTKVVGLSASMNVGPAEFGGMWADYEAANTELTSATVDATGYGAFVKFDVIEDLNLYAGYQKLDADKAYDGAGVKSKSTLTETSTYFGATYTLAPKVSVTGEYGMSEAKVTGSKAENDVLSLNLKVKF